MSEPVSPSHFVAYLVNEENKGYLYAYQNNEYVRISSPTNENAYVVVFDSRTDMLNDLRAMKCLCNDMVCFHREDLTPINFQKISNLLQMVNTNSRLSYRRCA